MRKIKILIMIILTIFIFFISPTFNVVKASVSGVLEDLKRDSSFDESIYPSKTYSEVIKDDNRLLDIISIAEAQDNSLVIYVYQPTDSTLEIVASSISISTGINDNFHPKKYDLKLLDTNGVFDKYLVLDFTILKDALRYYEIPTIYYPYNELIGKTNEFNETTNESGLEIAKRWTASTVDGKVSYTCMNTEVIKVTSIYPFMHRVLETDDYIFSQLTMYKQNVDYHCVAFNTDIDMDYILEIEMEYKKVDYWQTEINIFEFLWWDLVNIKFDKEYLTAKEDVQPIHKIINDKEIVNDDSSIFFPKYTWNRITSSSLFIDNNPDLVSDAKDLIDNYKWVLVFDTTIFEKWDHVAMDGYKGFETFEIVLLRFKFLKDGITYNLGVVSDVVTGSNNPINDDFMKEQFKKLQELLEKIFLILGIGILIILICSIFPPIFSVLKIVGTIIIFVITLPFKLIGSIFKKKNRK